MAYARVSLSEHVGNPRQGDRNAGEGAASSVQRLWEQPSLDVGDQRHGGVGGPSGPLALSEQQTSLGLVGRLLARSCSRSQVLGILLLLVSHLGTLHRL